MKSYLNFTAALLLLSGIIWMISAAADESQRKATSRSLAVGGSQTTRTPIGIYSKDQSHVYDISGNIIPNADPETFVLCDSRYDFCAKDSHYVYIQSAVLAGAAPQSFIFINLYYGKDKDHVFLLYGGEEGPQPHLIPNADAQSFSVLLNAYAKDSKKVYWDGYSITPPLDPKTVAIINGIYLKDTNGVYLSILGKITKIPDADPATFILLNNFTSGQYAYSKDATHIYYAANVVSADPNSFTIVTGKANYDATDGYHEYTKGLIVK